MGPPDACVYCRSKIGQEHGSDCVRAVREAIYDVRIDGIAVGTWVTTDPASWDNEMAFFHKNEGTWCSCNALEQGELHVTAEARARLEAMCADDAVSCACSCMVLTRMSVGAEVRRSR